MDPDNSRETRSLKDINLSLKDGKPRYSDDTRLEHIQAPMFFSDRHPTKTMIRAQFFLINRNADPTFLFQALLHEMPSFNQVFALSDDEVYQVKDFTRTLIPGRDPEKVREGDVKILVIPKRIYGKE
jgi:hypothetical protein